MLIFKLKFFIESKLEEMIKSEIKKRDKDLGDEEL